MWVNCDRFAWATPGPLHPLKRSDRCVALADATGQKLPLNHATGTAGSRGAENRPAAADPKPQETRQGIAANLRFGYGASPSFVMQFT